MLVQVVVHPETIVVPRIVSTCVQLVPQQIDAISHACVIELGRWNQLHQCQHRGIGRVVEIRSVVAGEVQQVHSLRTRRIGIPACINRGVGKGQGWSRAGQRVIDGRADDRRVVYLLRSQPQELIPSVNKQLVLKDWPTKIPAPLIPQ